MAVNLSPVGGAAAQFFDNNGIPLSGGLLYTYAAGTSTPLVTYTTQQQTVANSNPIVLDSAGRVPNEIWLQSTFAYKFVLTNALGAQVWSYDNLVGINSNFTAYALQEQTFTATQGQTVFTLTGGIQYVPSTNNLSVFVNGSKQIVSTNYIETSSTVVTFTSGLNVGDVVDFITAISTSTSATSAANISYNEGGIGAVTTNVQSKLRELISVLDFGADPTGVADSSTAFGNALSAAQSQGIGVFVPDGTYKILNSSAFPTQTNSITPVNIRSGANVTYIGTITTGNWNSIPTFGASKGNQYNLSTYNYLYSAPNQAIADPGNLSAYPFGFATLSVDSMPGTFFKGNSDAAFFQSIGQSGANFNLGGVNVLSYLEAGFLGDGNCMELDINNYAGANKGLGINIQGDGNYQLETGIQILRNARGSQSSSGAGGNWIPPWTTGITIGNAVTGIYINQSQVKSPQSAIGITPGPQASPTNLSIYIQDPASAYTFGVQNNGYIAYRTSAPITSFGTNVVSGTSPQFDGQFLMADQTVRLAGKLTATSGNTVTAGSTLFTLDFPYRPNRTVILPGVTDNGNSAIITINTSGVVTCNISLTSAFYLTLDSVSYLLSN